MFFDEITKGLGSDITAIKNFSYINVANIGMVVFANNSIVLYNSCKIILKCNKKPLYIYGQNLKIQSMSKTDFWIRGDIFCVSDREVVI